MGAGNPGVRSGHYPGYRQRAGRWSVAGNAYLVTVMIRGGRPVLEDFWAAREAVPAMCQRRMWLSTTRV